MNKDTNTNKDKEIMEYLCKEIFYPALEIEHKTITRIIKNCMNKMKTMTVNEKIRYYWSVQSTSPGTRELLNKHNLKAFEDIAKDFAVKFNDEWLGIIAV